jgi:hypothetical protein
MPKESALEGFKRPSLEGRTSVSESDAGEGDRLLWLLTGVEARADRELEKEWSVERCAATRVDLRGEYGS